MKQRIFALRYLFGAIAVSEALPLARFAQAVSGGRRGQRTHSK